MSTVRESLVTELEKAHNLLQLSGGDTLVSLHTVRANVAEARGIVGAVVCLLKSGELDSAVDSSKG